MAANFEAVRSVIQSYPVIDNHCHNLLREEHADVYPFESVTSEAAGQALKGVHSQLSHVRATRQLQRLYGSQNGDWDSILEARRTARRNNPQQLLKTIFAKTHCVLVDDGLDQTYVHPYHWHSRLTPAPAKRIVRIESIAETIVNTRPSVYEDDVRDAEGVQQVFSAFQGSFKYRLKQCIEDPDVAGFKSIICYRSPTSLDVAARQPDFDKVAEAFVAHIFSLGSREDGKKSRFASKILNDWLIHETLSLIRDFRPGKIHRKPLQLHTGLGDADIRLLEANPAYLQPLIEAYPMVPFVLLHSAYPYVREAGYLATVYSNVFLDLGEVYPAISRNGQLSVLRQALELTPVHKLLYSSDGHFFAESFHLAELQFREALEIVVAELMEYGELDGDQAKNLVQSILFENSNQLYRLGFSLSAGLTAPAPRSSLDSHETGRAHSEITVPITKSIVMNPDLANIDYVRVQWLDHLGLIRTRVLPSTAFSRLSAEGGTIAISQGTLSILQDDTLISTYNPVGVLQIKPDLTSFKPGVSAIDELTSIQINSATCMSNYVSTTGQSLPICPRGALQRIVGKLNSHYNLTPRLGFEIEVIFFRKSHDRPASQFDAATAPGWSTFSPSHHSLLPLIHAISTQLETMGITLEQFHAESAPGQIEFVLPPLPAVEAVDSLIQSRQAIKQLAEKYGYLATFHPQPRPGATSGSHVHVSLGERAEKTEYDFWGGVLEHLGAVCAFTMANEASYVRTRADAWSGGEWIAWGAQNRETPLRRIVAKDHVRWEVRCLDGLANAYLAAAAILGAGLVGLRQGLGLRSFKDCTVNPKNLTPDERARLGIKRKLPDSFNTAMLEIKGLVEAERLSKNGLISELGPQLVTLYSNLKSEEHAKLSGMDEEAQVAYLIDRY